MFRFSYQTEEKSILKILEIRKSSVVALVGESGGRKSSLIKLIQKTLTDRRCNFSGTKQFARCENS